MGKSIFICYIAVSKRGRRVAFSAGILFLLRFTWCYVYCSVIDDISFLAASCVFSLSRAFSLSRVFSRCLVLSRCLACFLAVSCVFSLSRVLSRSCVYSLSCVFSRCLACFLAVSCVLAVSCFRPIHPCVLFLPFLGLNFQGVFLWISNDVIRESNISIHYIVDKVQRYDLSWAKS